MTVASWSDFERDAGEIAAVGKALMYAPDRGEVALLATSAPDGRPRVAPVCPIFTDGRVYLCIGASTPKRRDLDADGRYALHAQVGSDDREFQMSGRARRVTDPSERSRVHAAIPFESFTTTDPVFELLIERALCVTWPAPGEPLKRAWHSARSLPG